MSKNGFEITLPPSPVHEASKYTRSSEGVKKKYSLRPVVLGDEYFKLSVLFETRKCHSVIKKKDFWLHIAEINKRK